MKRALCYFSGTGNSLYAAQIVAKTIGNCDILSITEQMEDMTLEGYDEVGIFSPVYAFSAPEVVLRFIDEIPISFIKKYVFAVVTCGGLPGDGLTVIRDRLEKNALNLSYGKSVTMPDNFTVFLPAPSEKQKNQLLTKAENKVVRIAHEIAVKTENKVGKGAFGIGVPLNKMFMSGEHSRDEGFILTRSCNSCGLCEKICPVKNIRMKDGKPEFKRQCQFCLGCFNRCPKGAINYGGSTVKKPRYVNDRVNWEK